MTKEDTLVILFADVCGSTALYAREGDSEAYARIQRTLFELGRLVEQNDGAVIKTIGDEVMCRFASCDAAVNAASEMGQGAKRGLLPIRVGLHYGPVLRDETDVFGDTVNVAARVVGLSQPGEILLTDEVAKALAPRWRVMIRRMQDLPIKGKETPVRVFRFGLADEEMTVFAASAPRSTRSSAVELIYDGGTMRVDADRSSVVIGRVEPADLVVRLSHVSRRHATVELQQGSAYLKDHSTNGTFVISSIGDRHLLQRETMPLPTAGRIWPGVSPSDAEEESVAFRLIE